jgi:hypothetical protein
VKLGRVATGPFASGGVAPPSGKMPVVPIPKQALAAINAKFAASLPAGMSKAQKAAAIKQFDSHFKVVAGSSGSFVSGGSSANNGGGSGNVSGPAAASAPKVIGKDWLSVVATPANPNVASAVQALVSSKGPAQPTPTNQGIFGGSSSSSAYSSTLTIQGGPNLAALRALLLATTPVHGNWGSGRLLQTKVVSVLITSKGQILIGAVTPAVLFADVPAAG